MYRKLIVGWDGSDQARDALALAGTLRAPDGAVTAACVHPDSGAPAGVPEPPQADWLEFRAIAGHSAAAGLHRLCLEEQPDLAVVGSSHRGELGLVLAGSVGERLLSGSPCPIALAPRGFRDEADVPRVVGVAYDGSDEARAALREAAALATALDATVRVVTVVPPLAVFASGAFYPTQPGDAKIQADRREEFRRMLESAAAELPAELRAAARLVDGPPAEAITEQAREGMHLLLMGSRSYGPLRRVMVGSTAIAVMRLAPCPVIVLPRAATKRPADAPAAPAAAP
jgi:nucleotide-binding universal stress UspA family protein